MRADYKISLETVKGRDLFEKARHVWKDNMKVTLIK
jgi:hypothetical protein